MKTSGPIGIIGILNAIVKAAPAYLMLLLPKCSLCLAAYLNLFSLAGISFARYATWILPALVILMVSSLVTGFFKARKMGDFRAFGLSAAGMLLLVLGRLWVSFPVVMWLGFTLVLSATWIQIIQSRKVCSQDLLRL